MKKIILISILFFLSCEKDPIFGLERGWIYGDDKKSSEDNGNNGSENNEKIITIISPNGGEIWELGSSQEITWTSENIGNKVDISLFRSNSLISNYSSIDNDGSYNYFIPQNSNISNNYKIKISSSLEDDIYDWSDGNFSISQSIQNCFTNFTVSNPDECYDVSNIFSFSWTGGCKVIELEYGLNSSMGYFLSLENNNYTSNFILYGFGPGETYYFQLHGESNQSSSNVVANTTSSIDCSDSGGGGSNSSHCTSIHYCSQCEGCESNCCPNYCSGNYYYKNRTCINGFCQGGGSPDTHDYCPNGCNENGCL